MWCGIHLAFYVCILFTWNKEAVISYLRRYNIYLTNLSFRKNNLGVTLQPIPLSLTAHNSRKTYFQRVDLTRVCAVVWALLITVQVQMDSNMNKTVIVLSMIVVWKGAYLTIYFLRQKETSLQLTTSLKDIKLQRKCLQYDYNFFICRIVNV